MKAIVTLNRAPNFSFNQFRRKFEEGARELVASFIGALSRYQRNYPDIAVWCSPADMEEAPYDCIVQLWFKNAAGFDQLRMLCGDPVLRGQHWPTISPLIDCGRIMCFKVDERNSTNESAAGKVKGMSFHVRRPHLDRAGFRDYYEGEHIRLVDSLFNVERRYQRNYPDASCAYLPEGMEDTPFDSVTQAWYDDQEANDRFRAAIGNPEVLAKLRDDEANFLDGSKSILFQVEEIEDDLGRSG